MQSNYEYVSQTWHANDKTFDYHMILNKSSEFSICFFLMQSNYEYVSQTWYANNKTFDYHMILNKSSEFSIVFLSI